MTVGQGSPRRHPPSSQAAEHGQRQPSLRLGMTGSEPDVGSPLLTMLTQGGSEARVEPMPGNRLLTMSERHAPLGQPQPEFPIGPALHVLPEGTPFAATAAAAGLAPLRPL